MTARKEEFDKMGEHVMFGKVYKRLSKNDRYLCYAFIAEHDHLDQHAFASKLNRWYLDVPEKPKRLNDMWALLLEVNVKIHR